MSAITYAAARLTIAFIWFYQGIIPKLIFHHKDELKMLRDAGFADSRVIRISSIIGLVEILLGLLILIAWRNRQLLYLNIALMVLATIVVAVNSPGYFPAAFNPLTLNLSMIALSLVAIFSHSSVPSARECIRRPPGDF